MSFFLNLFYSFHMLFQFLEKSNSWLWVLFTLFNCVLRQFQHQSKQIVNHVNPLSDFRILWVSSEHNLKSVIIKLVNLRALRMLFVLYIENLCMVLEYFINELSIKGTNQRLINFFGATFQQAEPGIHHKVHKIAHGFIRPSIFLKLVSKFTINRSPNSRFDVGF